VADVIEKLVSLLDQLKHPASSPPSQPVSPPTNPPADDTATFTDPPADDTATFTHPPADDTATFTIAVIKLIGPLDSTKENGLEGGYVNDLSDSGGETKYGITKRSYPDLDIKNLTKDQAAGIYYTDWWLKCQLGQLPPSIGIKMLDICVNMGARRGATLLQRALGRAGQDVAADGVIGPATITACVRIPEAELLQALRAQAAAFYVQLAADRPSDQKFLNGWLNRAQA
jgi:hypothetical protein